MRNKNSSIIITGIICAVVLIMFLIIFFSVRSSVSSSQNTVNVEGFSTISVAPDLLTVYFNAETEGETASEARDKNSKITNALITSLVLLGFDEKEIFTENFNIYPNYEWKNNQRIENGYKATHSLKIEISSEESNRLGDIIDAGVNSGANINYINFELSQDLQNEYKAQAIELAAKDARVKAEAVASGFGKSVGKLVSVQVSDFNYYPWRAYSGGEIMEDQAVIKEAVADIQPSERDVNARIYATYKLR